jgi:hypothetical protein
MTGITHSTLCTVALTFTLLLAACNDGECPEGNLGCSEPGANNGVAQPGGQTERDIVGEWELTYVLIARDAVDRPVEVAEVRWSLELNSAERNEFTGLYDVKGVVHGGTLCALTTLDFEAGSTGCTQVGLTLPGRCAGHTCTEAIDTPVTARYDPQNRTFSFGRQTLEAFSYDSGVGYVEVTGNLYHDALPTDGNPVESCGDNCTVSIVPDGYFEEVYPRYTSQTRRSSLEKLSERARAEPEPPSEREFEVGDASYASVVLLGEYDMRLLFYETDNGSATVVGELEYIFEIFEVNPIGTVGDYQWLGALRPGAVCWALDSGAPCETFGPPTLGRCASTCTEEREYAVSGFYDAFTFTMRINRTQADMYAGDSRAFIGTSVTLELEGESHWAEPGLAYRDCSKSCNWTTTSGGSAAEGLPPNRSGDGYSLIVERRE